MKTKSIALLALSALIFPFALQAKPGEGKPPKGEKVVERMDADQNGRISLQEAKGRLAKNFQRIDANSDGQVTAQELDDAHAKRKQKGSGNEKGGARLKKADADESGTISLAEATDAGLRRIIESFEKIDADGNGEITKDEMRAMRENPKKGQKNQQ